MLRQYHESQKEQDRNANQNPGNLPRPEPQQHKECVDSCTRVLDSRLVNGAVSGAIVGVATNLLSPPNILPAAALGMVSGATGVAVSRWQSSDSCKEKCNSEEMTRQQIRGLQAALPVLHMQQPAPQPIQQSTPAQRLNLSTEKSRDEWFRRQMRR